MKITGGLFLCFMFVGYANSQQIRQHEVIKLRERAEKKIGCFVEANVVTRKMFEKIIEDKDCAVQTKSLDVDFEKETLLAFHEGGDCFLSVESQVSRDDEAKKIKVKIKNHYGGCRAGGWFQGWIVIEKIPSDYTVEFSRQLLNRDGKPQRDEKIVKIVLPRDR